ncbi:MAG: hypothetical protein IH869_01800 [Chloroflexi bacterium]|nr:hypothetical protein [Chloroflexota bacterium]
MAQYDERSAEYGRFTERLASLIGQLVEAEGIKIHSVTYRVKAKVSLAQKLSSGEGPYSSLEEVTDVAGVRVITYFPDDVDRVSDLVEREFEVDEERSVDKRALMDPERFGYMSVHYIVKFSLARLALPEYSTFRDVVAEVQVRSILQHAWAEIEHDLGYKSKQAVPAHIRRDFARVAAFLETADRDFGTIRDALSDYSAIVEQRVAAAEVDIDLDQASLSAFLGAKGSAKADTAVAKALQGKMDRRKKLSIPALLEKLDYLHVRTIEELTLALTSSIDGLLSFVARFREIRGPIRPERRYGVGISIFYLGYFMAARGRDVQQIEDYLAAMRIGAASRRPAFAQELAKAAAG